MTRLIPRAYLSNAMTGHPDYNYPWFDRAAEALRASGRWLVINPAEAFGGRTDLPFPTYMRHDLEQLLRVDAIIVGPDWATSPGAVLEVSIAVALDLEVLEYVEDGSIPHGFSLTPPLPLFDTARDRLAFLLGLDGSTTGTDAPAGPEPMSTWAEADDGLLKAADHIVNGDRQRTYGHPINHHTTTAQLWSSYLTRVMDPHGEGPVEVVVRPQDVSILMVLDKVSRIAGGDKVDNLTDVAGYAQVHAKVRARQVEAEQGVAL